MKTLKIISLFAGCGGMDLGFLLAKHPRLKYEIVWANDFDHNACTTYRKNIGEIDEEDIWKVNLKALPDADVIIGGFPCQDFSILRGAERAGTKTKRGLLYTKFVDAAAEKLPMFFVAENVKGLLTANNGWAISKIKKDFEKLRKNKVLHSYLIWFDTEEDESLHNKVKKLAKNYPELKLLYKLKQWED